MNYLKLPLDFSNMLKGKPRQKCTLEESIAQYIMMQITCRYGEVAGRHDFGSDIWELEFNQLVKLYEWEERVKTSILTAITKYEKRLKNIKVNVSLSEIDTDVDSKHYSAIRRKAIIDVKGIMEHTGEVFKFNTTVYVSPLSQ
ncbi:GPW/gp25 family protein [Aquimarina rhabdastrellae]